MAILRENKGNSFIGLLDDYIIIDLETTGLDPSCDEIIEVAALKVSSGKIVGNYTTLVKPNNKIDDFITELTGITNEMLEGAPSLESVLPTFVKFVGNGVVVGHNVNFDINFLYDNMRKMGSPFSNDFIDIMRLSRRLFKEFENHKLTTIVQNFSVSAIPIHRALADCEATQACYEYMKQYTASNGIDLEALLATRMSTCKPADISATVTSFDESHPLYGKVCVFTGALSFTRKEAMQLVANVGGINADGVNKQTNFLIIGNNDYCTKIKDGKSNKQKKAEAYILAGQDIAILSETAFIDLLRDNQIKIAIPISENQMPAAHYAYAAATAELLKEAGVNTEWLRFSVGGERLDVHCQWLAFRVMICKKSTYIKGFMSLEEFKTHHPEAEVVELSKEYRIVISSPEDMKKYAASLVSKYVSTVKIVEVDLHYHPNATRNLRLYLGSKYYFKV